MSSEPKATPPHVNPTVREFPKRPSPLAAHMVANGFYYDEETGLVKPHQVIAK